VNEPNHIDWAETVDAAFGATAGLAQHQRRHPPDDPIDTDPVDEEGNPLTGARRLRAVSAEMQRRMDASAASRSDDQPESVIATRRGAELGRAVGRILRE
jgi:hypothetical protein